MSAAASGYASLMQALNSTCSSWPSWSSAASYSDGRRATRPPRGIGSSAPPPPRPPATGAHQRRRAARTIRARTRRRTSSQRRSRRGRARSGRRRRRACPCRSGAPPPKKEPRMCGGTSAVAAGSANSCSPMRTRTSVAPIGAPAARVGGIGGQCGPLGPGSFGTGGGGGGGTGAGGVGRVMKQEGSTPGMACSRVRSSPPNPPRGRGPPALQTPSRWCRLCTSIRAGCCRPLLASQAGVPSGSETELRPRFASVFCRPARAASQRQNCASPSSRVAGEAASVSSTRVCSAHSRSATMNSARRLA